MISYREKQLLAVMKYMNDQYAELGEQLSASLEATNEGNPLPPYTSSVTSVESFDELYGLAKDAGYDTFVRAEDILTPEEIDDLEKRRKEIDKQFRTLTKLTKKDLPLLLLGTGLQISRWAIITSLRPLSLDYKIEKTPRKERLTDKEGDKLSQNAEELKNRNENRAADNLKKQKDLEKEYDIKKHKAEQDYSDDGYRTVQQILFRPVPYDAENSTDNKALNKILDGISLGGTNHRSYTMGHDPVLGWIFGPINIMSRSITLKNHLLSTFPVLEKGNIITLPQSNIFTEIYHTLQSWNEDNNRFKASVIKQSLHYISDKYTKGGLPIPLISPEKAQLLINNDWNSVEAKKWIKKAVHTFAHDATIVGVEFFLSHYINELISIIHLLLYCNQDYNPELLEVKTKKIISISNTISSTSNVIYAAVKAYIAQNPIEGVKVLDIGGLIETIYRLATNATVITKIKDDFIKSTINNDFQDKLKEIEELYNLS